MLIQYSSICVGFRVIDKDSITEFVVWGTYLSRIIIIIKQ
jgi:hypothetical protein